MRPDLHIFLLGGQDLEMVEIKSILERMNCKYYDKNLKWGGRLSSYADVVNDTEHFIGIELIEDIPLPANYLSIDHHNELSNRNSSLEQVAEFLGIDLTRRQKLIAANDRDYIPGMKELGASEVEIKQIRRADRLAQGVTEHDERLADQSIKENLERIGDLLIVNSLTEKTSAISDRLYPFRKLLIRYQDNFFYTGIGVNAIATALNSHIRKGKVFFGGKNGGFIGSDKNSFTSGEVDEITDQIINITKSF